MQQLQRTCQAGGVGLGLGWLRVAGKIMSSNGNVYEGEWRDGNRFGQGDTGLISRAVETNGCERCGLKVCAWLI